MVSFVSYVLRYAGEGNAAGDVARDILQASGINRRWGYNSLRRYILHTYRPREEVLVILRDLKSRYDVNERYQNNS